MKPSRYNFVCRTDEHVTLYNALSGCVLTVPFRFQSENELVAAADLRAALQRGGFWVDDEEDELRNVLARHDSAVLDNGRLSLTILASRDCNLRCSYCYEKHSPVHLTEELCEDIYRYFARCSFKQLNICWFGGEPLLAFDRIVSLSSRVKALAHSKGAIYDSNIITNGTLLDTRKFRDLLGSGIGHFQVSLDGFEADNDRRRMSLCGDSPFRRILSNLEATKQVEGMFRFVIRVHADKLNFADLPKFFDFLEDRFGDDNRFRAYARAIRSDDTSDKCRCFTHREWLQAYSEVIRGRSSFILDSVGIPTPRDYWCPVQLNCYFLISPDRHIYKCDLLLQPENAIGRFDPNGPVFFENRLSRWRNANDLGEACIQCKFLPICLGGCKRFRLEQVNECPYNHGYVHRCIESYSADYGRTADFCHSSSHTR
jgi:uncharacterized protein